METYHVRTTPPDREAPGLAETVGDGTDPTTDELEALRRSEARLRLASAYAGIGVWESDSRTGQAIWSEHCGPLFGLPRGTPGLDRDSFLALVHTDDRERVAAALDRHLAEGSDYEVEFRVVWPDGTVRRLEAKGRATAREEAGRVATTLSVIIDVTERRRAEEEVREREDRLRALADAVPALVWQSDPDGRYSFLNDHSLSFTGWTATDDLDHAWVDALHPDDRARCVEHWLAAVAAQAPFTLEYRVRRRDGSYAWVADDGRPRFAPDGRFLGFIGAALDITERKRAEEAVRASEARYRSVVEAQTEMVCRYLPDTTLTFVNGAYCRYFGKPPKDLIGTSFLDLIPEPARAAARQHVESLVRNPRNVTYEHEVTGPDGSVCWQVWVDHAVFDADGNVAEFQGIGRDITDRKTAEERIRETEAKSRAILEALPDLMFLQTRDGVFLDCHGPPGEFHVPPEQFLGKNVREVLPPEVAEQAASCLARVFETREPQLWEYRLPVDGEDRCYEARVVPCGDNALSIVRDITQRRRSEEDLGRLTSRLLQSQDDERRRIARDLHETTAQSLVAVGLNLARASSMLPEESTQAAGSLAESRSLVEQVLRDIRTLSYVLHPPLLDHRGLAESLRWYVDGFVKRSGIDVELGLPKELGPLPDSVETAFLRIVQECLTNIHRHSGSGRAVISLAVEDDRLVLRVEDFGSGIDEVRSSASSERVQAVGVGIPGMRERLRQLHGRLDIVGDAGGTIVTASVPLTSASGG
jgi:PAS domain S-box-containing protein